MKLKNLIKESILGQMPSDKLMKMKWNPVTEANPDGTISPNEDKEMNELLDFVDEKMQEIFYEAEMETKRIGGQFRQPGYKSQVIKLMEKLIQGFERENR